MMIHYIERLSFSFCFLLYGLFWGGTLSVFCQNITIENHYQRAKVYVAIDNPLSIVVENVACDALFVSTDNGEIISKGAGHYDFRPDSVGIAELSIFQINGEDTILLENRKYRVQGLSANAKVGGLTRGNMNIGQLKAQEGMVAHLIGFPIDAHFTIQSFTTQIYRHQELVVAIENEGGKFEPEVKFVLENIQLGDKVVFTNIMVLMPGLKHSTRLEDVVLQVIK